MSGDLAAARDQLGTSVDIFRDLGDDIELAASLRERGFVEVFGGSLADAEWLLGEAEALSVRLDDPRGQAWVRQHQAWVAFLSGDGELAEQRLLLAAKGFTDIGDRSGANWATGLLAFLRFYEFRFDEAERLAVAVRSEANELGERWGPAMMDTLGGLHPALDRGLQRGRRAVTRRALHGFRELDDRFGMVQALGPRNRALVALGRDQEAERGLEEVLALGDLFGDLAFPLMAAAGTAVHLGLGERAVVVGESALERISAMGADGTETTVTYALGLCQTGAAETALAVLDGDRRRLPLRPRDAGGRRRAVRRRSATDRRRRRRLGARRGDLPRSGDGRCRGRGGRGPLGSDRSGDRRGSIAPGPPPTWPVMSWRRRWPRSATSTLLPGAEPGAADNDGQALRAGWRRVIAGLAGVDTSPEASAPGR